MNWWAETEGREDRLPAFFYRLSWSAQQSYLRSDAIDRFGLEPSAEIRGMVVALIEALGGNALGAINHSAQNVADKLCADLRVAPVVVEARGVRPRNQRGELHGIFYPRTKPPRIVLWMRTARRHQVVKPKTFVRTLAHELAHYLDYSLLRLGDSFHCRGFFRRESFLYKVLYPTSL